MMHCSLWRSGTDLAGPAEPVWPTFRKRKKRKTRSERMYLVKTVVLLFTALGFFLSCKKCQVRTVVMLFIALGFFLSWEQC